MSTETSFSVFSLHSDRVSLKGKGSLNMAHGRSGPDIVMTTRYADMGMIHGVSNHELNRSPDGSSAIDPARSHLNEILHGPATQAEAVKAMIKAGVKPPTKQAQEPFVQIVISASPDYFRGPLGVRGSWDQVKLDEWKRETMRWLKEEYGDDLAHVSLHLDEDTPHMHILIVPTYSRMPRKPGRQRKTETAEEFEERKRVAASGAPVRTMSRSSNEKWKGIWCRREARVSYSKVMEPLGLGYGRDYVGSGDTSPERKETGQWVREQAQEVKAERAALEADRAALEAERQGFDDAVSAREAAISEGEASIKADAKANADDRRDLDQIRGTLERRSTNLERVMQRVKRMTAALADVMGLPLPKRLSEALNSLEDEVAVYRERMMREADDPFSAAPEDTGDDSGPSFGM